VWSGDGNDTIIANDYGDAIQAGRGNNTIVAGMGADTLYGAPNGSTDTFVFNFLKNAPDTLLNWVSGTDIIDMHQLFTSIGYTGADPIADHWLSLISDSNGGTDFIVDPHNGQASMTIADLIGIAPTTLHEGIDYITTTKIA
jgi:RTX calcium-binding nonapeptide repeat (4 copies)